MSRATEDERLLARVARVFRGLGEPTRLRILCAIADGEQTVTAIVAAVGASQTSVSRHLQLLNHASLVKRRRSGARVLYRIASPIIVPLCRQIAALLAKDSAEPLPAAVVSAVFRIPKKPNARGNPTRSNVRRADTARRQARADRRP